MTEEQDARSKIPTENIPPLLSFTGAQLRRITLLFDLMEAEINRQKARAERAEKRAAQTEMELRRLMSALDRSKGGGDASKE